MLERRDAEIRRGRPAHRHAHGTDAHLDLVLGIVLDGLDLAVHQAPAFGLRQILVTPGVRTDGVARSGHLLEDARLIGRMQADREKDRFGAVGGERRQHRGSIFWPGAIVEG